MVSGGRGGRTASPNGSRPTLPTVHRPKVKWCSGRGSVGVLRLLAHVARVSVGGVARTDDDFERLAGSGRDPGCAGVGLRLRSTRNYRVQRSRAPTILPLGLAPSGRNPSREAPSPRPPPPQAGEGEHCTATAVRCPRGDGRQGGGGGGRGKQSCPSDSECSLAALARETSPAPDRPAPNPAQHLLPRKAESATRPCFAPQLQAVP